MPSVRDRDVKERVAILLAQTRRLIEETREALERGRIEMSNRREREVIDEHKRWLAVRFKQD